MTESTAASRICRICGNEKGNRTYNVREMLHGTREPFEYFECADCGCVQISEVPPDLGRYYPSDYQAYKSYERRSRNWPRRIIDGARVGYALTGKGILGRVAGALLPELDYVHWCRTAAIGRDHRILDFGCGAGKLLIRMMQGGFRHLEGADPFIAADIRYPGVTICKTGLNELAERRKNDFDFVMLHHSFEHIDHPVEVLRQLGALLADGGRLLLRIPVASSYAWKHYRENWYSLDPPRHLYLHTPDSLHRVAREAGMRIFAAEYDSTEMQFTMSELYSRDIPANAPAPERDIISKAQRRAFAARAIELNREEQGDQAAFYLERLSG
ncbi:MAG: class I SAM-dependent methyltransferase [Rhodospirillales bacterium]|nr:MAG: class I SAM-dependent methyltransferase [Rhodospirillales bacterium]